jgi:hypothetical protein
MQLSSKLKKPLLPPKKLMKTPLNAPESQLRMLKLKIRQRRHSKRLQMPVILLIKQPKRQRKPRKIMILVVVVVMIIVVVMIQLLRRLKLLRKKHQLTKMKKRKRKTMPLKKKLRKLSRLLLPERIRSEKSSKRPRRKQ